MAAADQQELAGADLLVNNAGVMLLGPFGSEQRDDYRQMIEVHDVTAAVATDRKAKPGTGERARPAAKRSSTPAAAVPITAAPAGRHRRGSGSSTRRSDSDQPFMPHLVGWSILLPDTPRLRPCSAATVLFEEVVPGLVELEVAIPRLSPAVR